MSEDPSKRTPPPISSNRAPGRYDKVTVPEMTSIPTLLGEIQAAMTEGFTRVNANIDATHEAIDGITDRVTRLEEAAAKNRTGPQKTYSGPIRALDEKTSQNDLKHESLIAQILTTQAATESKVDALTTTQTTQTEKLTKLETTVVQTDARKMEILEDVHKRATAFIDSPTGKLIKGILYLSLAAYGLTKGIHVGP